MSTWLALAAVIGVGGLTIATIRMRRRLLRSELRIRELEARAAELATALTATQADARSAGTVARRAATAVGLDEPPPRVAFEPVTGRVVKVVAFGAGARRAIARLTNVRDVATQRSKRSA